VTNLYITGGHLTPALAVIDELQKRQMKGLHISFIGRDRSREYPPQPSRERIEIERRDIPFYAINAAKYHREQMLRNISEFLKLPYSFYEVGKLFFQQKPSVILAFGGYVAFPVCLLGKVWGARIVIHEQTKAAGLANEVIAHLADVIAVANEESQEFFPREKTVVTGNPIRESLLKEYKTPPDWLPKQPTKPFIYVTGGSQGSQIINRTLAFILPKLVRNFIVIHQCGGTTDHSYSTELEQIRQTLPEELQDNYLVREWIEAKEVSYLMRHSKFVISRAGANTVEEISLSATPAIFIPLAFAYNNEQYKNALSLEEAGTAIILQQRDLVPETLYETIQTLNRRYDRMKEKALRYKEHVITDGTRRVIALLFPATRPE